MMIQWASNFSTTASETTTKHKSDFCYPYANAYFETVSSIVPYTVNAALNVPLAIVATLANILVFTAIRQSTSIRLPSKILLCSLVLTDLGVGLVVQPHFVTFLLTRVKNALSTSCLVIKLGGFAGSVLYSASLFTMAAISVDRYIALFFHLKYHEIVTTRRVCVVLSIIWSYSGFFASTELCNQILHAPIAITGIIVCFVVMSVAYIKIYRGLRHQHGHQVQDQAQVQAQQQTGNTLDLAKYRKLASSMLWIYGIFILCYLPFFCLSFVKAFSQNKVFMECILEFCITFVHFNSCLNPFVYCFRLPEIRTKVRQTLQKMCGPSPQQ